MLWRADSAATSTSRIPVSSRAVASRPASGPISAGQRTLRVRGTPRSRVMSAARDRQSGQRWDGGWRVACRVGQRRARVLPSSGCLGGLHAPRRALAPESGNQRNALGCCGRLNEWGLTIASQERTVTAGCTVTDGARRMHTMGDAAVFQPSVRLEWCASQPEASEDAERT